MDTMSTGHSRSMGRFAPCEPWQMFPIGNGTINHFLLYSPKIEAIKLEAATFSHLNIYLCLAAYSYQVKKLFGFYTSQNFIEGKLVPKPLFAMVLTDDDKHWFHEKSQPQAL